MNSLGVDEFESESESESEFGVMADALRMLQDTVSGVHPPVEVVKQAKVDLERLTALLSPYSDPVSPAAVPYR